MRQSFKYIIKYISIWIILNFVLNELALIATLILNHNTSSLITDSLRDIKYLAIQTVLFGLIFTIGYSFLKNKVISTYLFVIFQSLIFHFIFLLNIEYHGNTILFATTWDNFGFRYIEFNGTEITYLLNNYLNIGGIFDGEMYIPNNIYIFYFLWIFTPLIIYSLINWLTLKLMRRNEIMYKL